MAGGVIEDEAKGDGFLGLCPIAPDVEGGVEEEARGDDTRGLCPSTLSAGLRELKERFLGLDLILANSTGFNSDGLVGSSLGKTICNCFVQIEGSRHTSISSRLFHQRGRTARRSPLR